MEGMNYMENILTWLFRNWSKMVALKTTIDGILANFVYNGNLIWLPSSPTMCLRP